MRVTAIPIEFPNKRGKILRGTLHVPEKYTTAVVYAHGFPTDSTGNALRTSRALARAGVLALRFDFTGCGQSDGKHEERLMSGDVTDIRAAIDFLCAHAEFDTLILLGHSTGAITCALYAHTDKRLDGVILSGSVSDLRIAVNYEFTPLQVRDFLRKGYTLTAFPLRWSGKRERIAKKFYDEFFTLDIQRAIKRYHKPLLVIHGEKDRAIPVVSGRELYTLANKPKKFVVIPRADHSYHVSARAYYDALLRFIRSVERR